MRVGKRQRGMVRAMSDRARHDRLPDMMTLFSGRYRVESARRRGWNYADGSFFVTLCTQRRALFYIRRCIGRNPAA